MERHIYNHTQKLRKQLRDSISGTENVDIIKSDISQLDYLEKGKKQGAPVGTIKDMGGRPYIKTAEGWKYHGKGEGAKAQENAASSGHAQFKVGAGHKITTGEGVTGTVKHQDATHTYLEHKKEDGKTKVSKIKNEDVESNVKTGKWEHHIPASEAQKGAQQSAAAASGTGEKKLTESDQMAADKMKDIATRFKTFEMMAQAVIRGRSKSMIAYGTGGVGKTYTVAQQLKKANKIEFDEDRMKPGDDDYDYVKITGKATPTAVYKALYEHNKKIVMFDDCDSVLKNPDAVNFFKGALDTSGDGTISYGSSKKIKDEDGEDLPQRFKFTGRVIFISNLPPDEMPQPLKSRGLKIDLSMDKKQTVDRIRDIATNKEGKMQNLQFPGIESYKDEDMKTVIDYIDKNKDHIGDLNVRTIGKILTMKQMADEIGESKNWEKYADQELFSKSEDFNYNGGIFKGYLNNVASLYKSNVPPIYKSEDVKSHDYIQKGGVGNKKKDIKKAQTDELNEAFASLIKE